MPGAWREGFHVKHTTAPWTRFRGLHWRSQRGKMFHVKPPGTAVPPSEESIAAALSAAGLGFTQAQVSLLRAHAAAVLAANEITNLTRITDPEDFVRLHIVDSLMPLHYAELGTGRLIDIGSGAGFPGIPLAIMGCSVTLCEARKKKAEYLSKWSRDLGLSAEVLPLRAEEVAADGNSYDWVLMRAVSSLASLVELAAPLLNQGGRMVSMKGVRNPEEEDRAARASRMTGMVLESIADYQLPRGPEQRTLYTYVRSGSAQIRLPRRQGLAQTEPLG
ncbi:MAG: 16S rRNA (guanine(527)-N(7))-methyltransferase RsmG [Coriobacteriia bacterium]